MPPRILRAALTYFALVFALGFALGSLRVPLLVPHLGVRTAELIELPFMVLGSAWLAAFRVRCTRDLGPRQQLAVGGLALLCLLTAEVLLGVWLTGRGPLQVLFDRDPVAGPVYYSALLCFALWPWWFARRASQPANAPRC
ncbi:MAG: hypothetical protein JNK49_10440 [Planctomycetes bacterium]|nr:hypothetical protein [Planctomycetota bacterium]